MVHEAREVEAKSVEAARKAGTREVEAREAEAEEVREAEPPPRPPSVEGGEERLMRGASVGDAEAEAALEQLAQASREAGAELIRTKQAREQAEEIVDARTRSGIPLLYLSCKRLFLICSKKVRRVNFTKVDFKRILSFCRTCLWLFGGRNCCH